MDPRRSPISVNRRLPSCPLPSASRPPNCLTLLVAADAATARPPPAAMEAGFGASELSSQFAALDAGGGASGGADPHCGAPASSAAPAVAAETAQAAQAVLAQAQDPVGGEAALLDSLVMTARDAAEGGVTGMLHGAVPPGAAVAAPHAWSLHAQQQAHAVHAAQAQTQVYVAHAHGSSDAVAARSLLLRQRGQQRYPATRVRASSHASRRRSSGAGGPMRRCGCV